MRALRQKWRSLQGSSWSVSAEQLAGSRRVAGWQQQGERGDLLPSPISGGGSHFIHRAYPAALSAGRAAAQVSRASLRVGPTLGSHLRAMRNTTLLYKYFTNCITLKVGISSNILKRYEAKRVRRDGEGTKENLRKERTRMPKVRSQARTHPQVWALPLPAVLQGNCEGNRLQKIQLSERKRRRGE